MKVGLVDVDGGKRFPNIALMKISAWHKAQGDTVEWLDPMFGGHYGKVYLSKVFSFSPDYDLYIDADEVVRGGSGYCIDLRECRPQGCPFKTDKVEYPIKEITKEDKK